MTGNAKWLTEDQQRVWRAYIALTRRLDESLARRMQDDSDLALSDYLILMLLSESTGRRLRMSDLADATVYSRSRLSHAVARLEDLGWVHRARATTDGRGTYAELTDEGFAVLAAAAPDHAAAVLEFFFEPLGDAGYTTLGELLDAIDDRLDREPGDD
jgi:DNA-binding MarR family transcriptional regulator